MSKIWLTKGFNMTLEIASNILKPSDVFPALCLLAIQTLAPSLLALPNVSDVEHPTRYKFFSFLPPNRAIPQILSIKFGHMQPLSQKQSQKNHSDHNRNHRKHHRNHSKITENLAFYFLLKGAPQGMREHL